MILVPYLPTLASLYSVINARFVRCITFVLVALGAFGYLSFSSPNNSIASDSIDTKTKCKYDSLVFPSVLGKWKSSLELKPILSIGYSVPIVPQYSFRPNGDPFSDLTTFSNWTALIGIQVTKYLSFEVGYSSFSTTISLPNSSISNGTTQQIQNSDQMIGQMIQLTASAYSPAINLKFVTLSSYMYAGMAGIIGVQHNFASSTSSSDGNGIVITYRSKGPQFIGGVGIMLGFSSTVTIKAFVEAITFSDAPYGVNVILRSGFLVNVYLL